MLKMLIAIVIGTLIGVACRYFDVPVPAPPKLLGAILVLAMTLGYIGMDRMMQRDLPATAVVDQPHPHDLPGPNQGR
jgi:XapX domain-containing protein